MSTTEQFGDKTVSHQIYMRGQATRINNEILEYLDALKKELLAKLAGAPTSRDPRHINALIAEVDVLIEEMYLAYGPALTEKLQEIGEYESRFVANTAATFGLDGIQALGKTRVQAIVTDDPFDGKILSEWFTDQEQALKRNVRRQIRLGMGAGEGVAKLSERVLKEGYDKAKRHSETLVRTAVNHISNTASKDTYQQSGVEKYQISGILDSRTTLICASLDGKVFRFDDPSAPRPPFHPGCRTTIVPVIDDEEYESTYEEFFERRSEKEKREYLGPARYKLYKDGMRITEFVDSNLQVIPLRELEQLETA